MEINQKLKDAGTTAGIILGYIIILIGFTITLLLLETIYSEI
ncbi:MAG: hypothetical protein PHU34_03525 [Candidatus Methanoperedens sp.]|nr:hypothetical protein [Candidatus Methanoperedens sp.]